MNGGYVEYKGRRLSTNGTVHFPPSGNYDMRGAVIHAPVDASAGLVVGAQQSGTDVRDILHWMDTVDQQLRMG